MITRIRIKNTHSYYDLKLDDIRKATIIHGDNGALLRYVLRYVYCALSDNPSNALLDFFPVKRLGELVLLQTARIQVGLDDLLCDVFFTRRAHKKAKAKRPKQLPHVVYLPRKDYLSRLTTSAPAQNSDDALGQHVLFGKLAASAAPEVDGLRYLRQALVGHPHLQNGRYVFHHDGRNRDIPMELLGEGAKKLSLLWLALRKGGIRPGSILLLENTIDYMQPRELTALTKALSSLDSVQVIMTTMNYGATKDLLPLVDNLVFLQDA